MSVLSFELSYGIHFFTQSAFAKGLSDAEAVMVVRVAAFFTQGALQKASATMFLLP